MFRMSISKLLGLVSFGLVVGLTIVVMVHILVRSYSKEYAARLSQIKQERLERSQIQTTPAIMGLVSSLAVSDTDLPEVRKMEVQVIDDGVYRVSLWSVGTDQRLTETVIERVDRTPLELPYRTFVRAAREQGVHITTGTCVEISAGPFVNEHQVKDLGRELSEINNLDNVLIVTMGRNSSGPFWVVERYRP